MKVIQISIFSLFMRVWKLQLNGFAGFHKNEIASRLIVLLHNMVYREEVLYTWETVSSCSFDCIPCTIFVIRISCMPLEHKIEKKRKIFLGFLFISDYKCCYWHEQRKTDFRFLHRITSIHLIFWVEIEISQIYMQHFEHFQYIWIHIFNI